MTSYYRIVDYVGDTLFEMDAHNIKEAVENAVWDRVDLSGAQLGEADLRMAVLKGCQLAWSDLVGADLTGADLIGANFHGANLSLCKGVIFAGTPSDYTTFGWLRDGYLSIRVGCRERRLDEARDYWSGKDDRREVLAAVEYIAKVAKARGWPLTEAEAGQ